MDVYMSRALDINQSLDCQTFEAIYRQYYKNVYNYISFRINNHFDAEELASTVFENVLRKYHSYKPEKSPIEAWLIGIAKNVVTDYLRKKKFKFFVPIDELLGLVAFNRQPEEVVVMAEDNKALIHAMSKLKDVERQILSMKFATDLKNCEIAKLLDMGESNVGVIIHRAAKKLKKYIEKECRQ